MKHSRGAKTQSSRKQSQARSVASRAYATSTLQSISRPSQSTHGYHATATHQGHGRKLAFSSSKPPGQACSQSRRSLTATPHDGSDGGLPTTSQKSVEPTSAKAQRQQQRGSGSKGQRGKPVLTESELNEHAAASHYENYAIHHTVYTNTRSEDFHLHQQKHPSWRPYHDAIPSTMSLNEFITKYKDLPAGSRLEEDDGIVLNARIDTKRVASQKLFFYDVHSQQQDFSSSNIQIICSQRRLNEHDHSVASLLKKGDWVSFTGFPGKSDKGELSLIATEATLLSPCLHLPPTNLSDPNLRFRARHLDLMVNRQEVMEIFRVRTGVFNALREYLNSRGGVEVETPILWTQSGGATARPFHTVSNAFGSHLPLSLRIAPELFLKQLVIGGMEKVYEIGKVFRNEGIDATHSPEFTSCELYQAHANYITMMDFTEDLLRTIVQKVKGQLQVNIVPHTVVVGGGGESGAGAAIAGEGEPSSTSSEHITIDFSKPFPRLDVIDTLRQHGIELPDNFNDPEALPMLAQICAERGFDVAPPYTNARYLDKLISEIIEPMCIQPTFIIHQPVCLSPLAKHLPSNPNVTERFELFINTKEYANAYSELNVPVEQLERFSAQHKQKVTKDASGNEVVDDEAHPVDLPFCESLQYGLPPTGGWGLGIDRLVMLLSNQHNIRDVLLFPIMKPQH